MELKIEHLSKSFQGLPVLKDLNLSLSPGPAYCLMAPSGSGKTTLFRILLGLEQPDSGSILGLEQKKAAAVFQENRLCPEFTPVENVAMALPGPMRKSRALAFLELSRLLPSESLLRPVSTLSGGMKRRVAIVRALTPPSDFILMDEPFTGLDEDTRLSVIGYIKERAKGRLLIISTHQEEDVGLLNGILITL